MNELQKGFVVGFLTKFLSEYHMPLGADINESPQDNDIPPQLILRSEDEEP